MTIKCHPGAFLLGGVSFWQLSLVRFDPKTGNILEIYDPPTGKTDAISDAISMLIKKIFKEGRVPKYLWTDKRKEYYNKSLKGGTR